LFNLSKSTTTPTGNHESPFNLPHLAASCGASYVARWTTMDVRRLNLLDSSIFGIFVDIIGFP